MWFYFILTDSEKTATCGMCGQRLCFESTISNFKKTWKGKRPTVSLQAHKQNPYYTFDLSRDAAPENFQEDLSSTMATISVS